MALDKHLQGRGLKGITAKRLLRAQTSGYSHQNGKVAEQPSFVEVVFCFTKTVVDLNEHLTILNGNTASECNCLIFLARHCVVPH